MIIPNKFIPMLKESTLFKSRSSSNDLSDFLKPKLHDHDTENGQTRQNLMNSLGMDSSQSPGMGGGEGNGGSEGGNGMGGLGGIGAMANVGRMAGMNQMDGAGGGGAMGEMNQMTGAGGGGDMGGMAGMQGNGQMGGINDQINAINGMGNSDAQKSPLEGNQNGNGMNSMNNGVGQGMNSDPNNPPAGDPMGTLKDMLSSQATNAALGTNSEAFGPGGAANSNVLAMLNQIVGKEMPGDSPVDPSSKQQQNWDELQKNFNSQKPAGIPYIDSDNSKSTSNHDQPNTQNPSNRTTNTAAQPVVNAPVPTPNNPSAGNASTIQSSTSNPPAAIPLNQNPTTTNPTSAHSSTENPTKSNPTAPTNLNPKVLHSEKEGHAKALTKTTPNFPQVQEEDEDQPLSADMVNFLKGVKFVVSQEPGNDIILGKKFSSSVPPDLTDSLREENGVMKNVVSESTRIKNTGSQSSTTNEKWPSIVFDDIGSTRGTSSKKDKDFAEHIKAAKVLERASKKLKDPVAKKSTEVAIASILKVVALSGTKRIPSSNVDLLNGGDVRSKLSEKYIEAARVLGTASKKLVDPVAKKCTEIGIASILKVIALGEYPTSKKAFVPGLYRGRSEFVNHLDAVDHKKTEKYEKVANDLDAAVRRTMNLSKFKKL